MRHRGGTVLAALVAFAASAAPVSAADLLLLQQNLPPQQAGTAFLLIDRTRISLVTATKGEGLDHRITIRLATEPPEQIQLTCNDQATTRQLLDMLRRGAADLLDVTGRCRL